MTARMKLRTVGGRAGLISAAAIALAAGTLIDASAQQQAAVNGTGGVDQVAATPAAPPAPAARSKPDFPDFDKVADGLTEVVSIADGEKPWYELHADRETGRLLAVLPRNYDGRLMMIAATVAGGDEQAGVMGPTWYGYWKKIGKDQLAFMQPNFINRSTGDDATKRSVESLYTETMLLSAPIVSMKNGAPVIDLQKMLLGDMANVPSAFGGYGPTVRGVNARLASLEKAKAFPQNFEVAYRVPDRAGRMLTLHWSFRDLPENKSYKPRLGDDRVGYFNVYYNEMGEPGTDQPFRRLITRWQIEKADPKRAVSPPKQPLVWYIEHTTPIRYRRYVREGILAWNEAFEAIGIYGALEVYQQDADTGAHMDKDPEDARYNFFRWNTSNQGYAIGPSRWDPRTGQIVDADVVWHAGLTNAVINAFYKNITESVAMSGMTPETLAWLDEHPEWDPRVRLAPPVVRGRLLAERRDAVERGERADHAASERAYLEEFDGVSCRIGEMMALNIALYSAALDGGLVAAPGGDMMDGVPEEFLGPMIRYISAHEVGHCIGLQHNFGASTIRSLDEINAAGPDEPLFGSVMEYAAANVAAPGREQGPFTSPGVGPYDMWAIAFGYGDEKDRDEVLARVSEPDHIFLSPYATIGPDPRAQTWDLGADPLEFAEQRLEIVTELRKKIVDELVNDGDSWMKARQRYNVLLGTHVQAAVVAARWVGGAYTNWDRKGDPGDRAPIEDVPADTQRRALKMVIDNTFYDDAFGLTPEMLRHFGLQYWPDQPGFNAVLDDPIYSVHDTVAGVQAASLTFLMNPTTLRRVYDNEFRTAGEENPITLAEVFDTISDSIWSELTEPSRGRHSATNPKISSLRRNLQREHLERLIDLALIRDASSPAYRTIANLSRMKLQELAGDLRTMASNSSIDDYTRAHCMDCEGRIAKALDGVYLYRR